MRYHVTGLTVSLLIHGTVLAAVIALSQRPAPPEPVSTALPLSLNMFAEVPKPPAPEPPKPAAPSVPEPVKKPEPPPAPVEQPKPRPKPVAKPKPRPEPVPKPRPSAPQPVDTPVQTPPQEVPSPPPPAVQPAAPAVPPVNLARLEDSYKAKVRSAIEANKHYPARARRMRQQGTVVVSLTLTRSGQLGAVSVLDSSGSDILDQAALESVRAIDGQLPFPKGIERGNWTFSLPLKFSLR